jgi:hypothetical protein
MAYKTMVGLMVYLYRLFVLVSKIGNAMPKESIWQNTVFEVVIGN